MKLLSATYSTNYSGYATINLFGVGGQRKTIQGFQPYFICQFNSHISEPVAKQLLRQNGFYDIQTIYRFEPIGYQTEKKMMFKVALGHPKEVRDARQIAAKIPNMYKLYESDVLFINRFLIDNDLGGFCDVPIDNERVDIESPRLSYFGFDIECLVPSDGTFPKPESDPIVIISLALDNDNRVVLTTKESTYQGCQVIFCKTEKELIEMFISIIKVNDPDIIGGFNSNNFDFNYIATRCKILGIKPTVGRDSSEWWIRNKPDGSSDVLISGRVVVDLMLLIRRNYSLPSYNLRTVASLVGMQKLDITPIQMREAYINGISRMRTTSNDRIDTGNNTVDWNDVVSYADRDAELVMHLLVDLKIIDKYVALSKASGLILQDIINSGQSQMIEFLLMKEFKKRDRVMANKPPYDESQDSEEVRYEGATVLEPPKGLQENLIILDYKSLYPTLIMAHNISYDSLVLDASTDASNTEVSPTGAKFVTTELYRGILPSILGNLLDERIATKKLMKNCLPEEKDFLDAKQYALKILLNSYYGYCGYIRSRLFTIEIAESVTAWGRLNIENTVALIKTMGMNVIYGDSITGDRCILTKSKDGFISLKPIEDIFNEFNSINILEKDRVFDIPYETITHLGWKPIKSLIRHYTTKKIYRISQKFGETICTEDHSIMNSDLIATKPCDMIKNSMYRCNITRSIEINEINIFDFLKSYSRSIIHFGKTKTSKFELVDDKYIKFGWKRNNYLIPKILKNAELAAFCRLIGAFVTEGHISHPGENRTGIHAVISSNNLSWLSSLKDDYEMVFINSKGHIYKSGKTSTGNIKYALLMSNSLSGAVFDALCGHNARDKRLPNFVYNLTYEYIEEILNKMIEGDGSRKHGNVYSDKYHKDNFRFTSVSLQLISGLSVILNIKNIKHTIRYSKKNSFYELSTVYNYNSKKHTKLIEEKTNRFVYDLEVEDAHTFCDSCGNILLHNTDSVFIKNNKYNELDDIKKVGELVASKATKALPAPMELVFEAIAKRAIFLAKKRYSMWRFEPTSDGWSDKIKSKGIETVRRDWAPIVGKTINKVLEMILKHGDITGAAEYAHQVILQVKLQDINKMDNIQDLILTKKYSRMDYKMKPVHVQLIDRMVERGEEKPQLGDRIEFIIVNEYGRSFSRSAETLGYAKEHNLTINSTYYLTKQILPPLVRIFEVFGIDEEMLVKGIYVSKKSTQISLMDLSYS